MMGAGTGLGPWTKADLVSQGIRLTHGPSTERGRYGEEERLAYLDSPELGPLVLGDDSIRFHRVLEGC